MASRAPCAKAGRGGGCRSPFSPGREGGRPGSPLGGGHVLLGCREQMVGGLGPARPPAPAPPEGPTEAQEMPGTDASGLRQGLQRPPAWPALSQRSQGYWAGAWQGSSLCLLPRLLPPSCRDLPGLGTARTRIRSGCWLGSCPEHAGAEPAGANSWVRSRQPQACLSWRPRWHHGWGSLRSMGG